MTFHHIFTRWPTRCLGLAGLALLAGAIIWNAPLLQGQESKTKAKPTEEINTVSMGAISQKEWLSAATKKLTPAELDQLINSELGQAKIKPAPLCKDEEFIRRVYLDVTGTIPTPEKVTAFLKDTSPDKRSKLIDQLLDSEGYAKHWGRYWKNVVATRLTDFQSLSMAGEFERWLTEQFKKNAGWGEMTTEMLTATGAIRRDEPNKNGQAFFLLAYRGNDALTERTAETSRIFMGIQIQCAQCHDHPFDDWKRIQFHELAAYLAKAKDRFVFNEDKKIVGQSLISFNFGEHRMVDNDKKINKVVYPKFLDGTTPPKYLKDTARREALAKSITSKDNPWFAAAFANRVWSELLGQTFYQPIDDLGPQREAIMPKVIARLAGSFRGSDYNIKELYRVILNSETYQRQSRMGKSTDEHLYFAASYPKKLNSDALWNSLEVALGKLEGGGFGKFGKKGGGGFGGFGRFGGLKGQFTKEFGYDPSARPEEVEGTLPQALLLMNNQAINQKIKANNGILGGILKDNAKNEDALKLVYLRVLIRYPSDNEMKTCLNYIQETGSRTTAFEDILWALINSTEFQTKR